MAGRIPQSFIDEVLRRTDIVDLIGASVRLKKTGKNYSACCPFHNEKSPSFTVNRDKQFYHCFGCGAHGDAIGFLVAYDHQSFVEAVGSLAKEAGMELPDKGLAHESAAQNPLYDCLQKAKYFYQQALKNERSVKVLQYLKQRGLSPEIIQKFGLGFAPFGWDNLLQYFEKQQVSCQTAETAGLLVLKEGKTGWYDRFRDRLMFPICNRKGAIIGFGGRVLNDTDKPKYLNSPETPVFHKGRELYGLYEGRQSIRDKDQVLVVEGYMDVIALHQQGIENAVATLGTALSEYHLEQLTRLVSTVIFCFDGDNAGQQAAWRALQIALPFLGNGKQFCFLILPPGEDPDSWVRAKGQANFLAELAHARPLSQYLLGKLIEKVDLVSAEGKARLVSLCKEPISKITDPVLVQLFWREVQQRLGLSDPQMGDLIKGPGNRQVSSSHYKKLQKGREPHSPVPIRLLVDLLIKNPSFAHLIEADDSVRNLELPGLPLLLQLIDFIHKNKEVTTQSLLSSFEGTSDFITLNKLLFSDSMIPEEGQRAEFEGAWFRLQALAREKEMELLLAKSRLTGLERQEKLRLQDLLRIPKTEKA